MHFFCFCFALLFHSHFDFGLALCGSGSIVALPLLSARSGLVLSVFLPLFWLSSASAQAQLRLISGSALAQLRLSSGSAQLKLSSCLADVPEQHLATRNRSYFRSTVPPVATRRSGKK